MRHLAKRRTAESESGETAMQPTLTAMSAVLALAVGAGQSLEPRASSTHPTDVAKSRKDRAPRKVIVGTP